jgi:hypothetical protein
MGEFAFLTSRAHVRLWKMCDWKQESSYLSQARRTSINNRKSLNKSTLPGCVQKPVA